MLLLPVDPGIDLDELFGLRIVLFLDMERTDASEPVRRRMRHALMLGQCEIRGIPGTGPAPGGLGDGQPGVISYRRAGDTLLAIFLVDGIPVARQSDLRTGRHAAGDQQAREE